MAEAVVSARLDPLGRATEKLIARFERGAHERPQPLLLLDPPGYGASKVLDEFGMICRSRPEIIPKFKIGSIPERSDAFDTLDSILIEVAAIASADPGELPLWRQRLAGLWRDRADPREDIDRYLKEVFAKIAGVVLCVPRIDKLIISLASATPPEDWQLRGYINEYPIRLIATSPAEWRPKADQAFFQSFWRIRPEIYDQQDIEDLIARLRLKQKPAQTLTEITAQFAGRAQLVERAAGILVLSPDTDVELIMRDVARTPPAEVVEQLGSASRQGLKILASAAKLELPVEAGVIAKAANVTGNTVSTQMARLAEIGLITIERTNGRDHRYAFADEVTKRLYETMIDP